MRTLFNRQVQVRESQNPAAGQAPRTLYLDGLRGLASLSVALSHYIYTFYPALLDAAPAQSHSSWDVPLGRSPLIFFYNPNLAVAVFFVLSGFVLASSLADRRVDLLVLIPRRWVRLCLPMLGIILPIWAAVHAGAAMAQTHSSWLGSMYLPLTMFIPLPLIFQGVLCMVFNDSPGRLQFIDAAVWTMPIELWGSLGLYVCYWLAGDWLRRPYLRLAVAILGVLVTWNTPYYGFGLGVALFELRRFGWRPGLSWLAWPLGAGTLVCGIWAGGTPFATDAWHQAFIVRTGIGVEALQHAGAALLVAATLLLRPLQHLLLSRFCQYLGRVSFMLYLLHLPVLCSMGLFVFLYGPGGYHARALAALVVYLAGSVALAEAATRWIDWPSIQLSRWARLPMPARYRHDARRAKKV